MLDGALRRFTSRLYLWVILCVLLSISAAYWLQGNSGESKSASPLMSKIVATMDDYQQVGHTPPSSIDEICALVGNHSSEQLDIALKVPSSYRLARSKFVDLDGDEVDSWTISRSERLVTTRYVVIYRKLDGRCIALMRVDSPF